MTSTVDSQATQMSGPSVDVIRSRLTPLLHDLTAQSVQWEHEPGLPVTAMDHLRGTGLPALRIPRDHGGSGATMPELFSTLMVVATAEPNLAHALRNHFATTERILLAEDGVELAVWSPRIVAGDIFGSATTDIGTNRVDGKSTILSRSADGELRLNGTKHYCTGTYYAQWLPVLATMTDGEAVTVMLPAEREGIERHDNWRGFGQRLTATGTTDFVDVVVHPSEVVTGRGSASVMTDYGGAYRQLHLAAVIAGIGQRIVEDTVEFVRKRARPAVHARADSSSEDLFVQRTVGQLSSAVWSARLAVLAAAEGLDALFEAIRSNDPLATERRAQVAADVARTQLVVSSQVLDAANRMFEVGGGSMTNTMLNLDRHWRNARAISQHNPLDYKAQVIGDYLVNDQPPPSNGFF